jgi:hypothetical protein
MTKYIKNDAGLFVCPDCGETKKRQNTMFYHMKKHTGNYDYPCKEAGCDKAFIQKSGLEQHMMQVHRKEKGVQWSCPCCDHTCTMKNNMMIHIGRKHGSGWIPEAETKVECLCNGCATVFNSDTAYYYHAISCFEAPADIAEKLALLSTM